MQVISVLMMLAGFVSALAVWRRGQLKRQRQALHDSPPGDPDLFALETTGELPPDALHHENWRVRLAVVQHLADDVGVDSEAALVQALRDTDADVREAAAAALAARGAVDVLLAALEDRSVDLRALAARTLSQFPRHDVEAALITALHDSSTWVRTPSAWSLGTLRSSAAVPGLIALLAAERDADTRQAAVAALRQIDTPEARLYLREKGW